MNVPEISPQYKLGTGITACGFQPLLILLHLLPRDIKTDLLKYTTSGELTGNFQNSVSDVAMTFR